MMAVRIWVLVPDPPDTTARDYTPVSLTQCPMLPESVLPIGGTWELSVFISGLPCFANHQHIIPVVSENPQITIFKTAQGEVWQQANAKVGPLPQHFLSLSVGISLQFPHVHQVKTEDGGAATWFIIRASTISPASLEKSRLANSRRCTSLIC